MSDRFGHIPIQSPESPPPAPKPTKRPPRGRALKKGKDKRGSGSRVLGLIAALVIIIAGYSAAGFLGAPYYFRNILPKHFQAATGMALQPSTVTFNPFTFHFETGEIRILSESGATLLSLQSIVADVAPVALFRLKMVCKTVTVDKLDLNIAREADGTYNFQQIFGAKKGSKISEIINYSAMPIFFSLNNISIINSKITFNDTPAGKIHIVDKMKLDLPNFSNIPFQTDQYLQPHFSAVVNGSPIELTGEAPFGDSGNKEQATKLSLNVQDLELITYADYLPLSLPMQCKKGIANGKIDLLFNPQNTGSDKLSIGFELQLSAAEFNKEDESLLITVPNARVVGTLQPVSRTLHFTEITVKEPIVSSLGKSFLENIHVPAKKVGQSPPPNETAVEAAPYGLSIDLLLADNGVVRLFPEKNDQPPSSSWKTMQLSIKDFRSITKNGKKENEGSFSLSGEKDGSPASFSWQGTFSASDQVSGRLNLRKMDCKDLLKTIDFAHPFRISGVADLKGDLIFYTTKEVPTRLRYKFVDADITLDDFVLFDKKQSILTAPIAKIGPLSMMDKSINFGNVQLQKGDAQFIYGRIPKIFSQFESNQYRLEGIDFEGKVTFSPDEKSDQTFALTNVSLKANQLDKSRKTPDNLSVSGKTKTGGIIKAQGNCALAPFAVTLKTGFRELSIQEIRPFFTTAPLLVNINGTLSGKGQLTLPGKSFAGELELTDVSGKGPQKNPFSWQKSIFQDLNYTAKPFHFGATAVTINKALFAWEITGKSHSPTKFFSDFIQNYFPSEDIKPSGKQRITISPVDIQEISFTESKIAIHDRRLTPALETAATGFTGKIKNIHSAAASEKTSFTFTGSLVDAPFSIDGEMNPFVRKENGTFHLFLEKYPLSSLGKQFATKTNLNTDKGQVQLTLDGTWKDQQYISSGTLTLVDLGPVTATSEQALALALLTDREGSLKLPFEFSRTAPVAQTSLVDELTTSFQRLLLKGSVSPLLLASDDFTDLIGNEFIEFRPGEFMFSETGRQVLSRYGALLIGHPNVGVVLSGGVDKKVDTLAMKKSLTAIEQRRVEKENEKLYKEWQEQKALYQKKLDERLKNPGATGQIVEENIPAEVLTGFTPIKPVPIVVDEAMLLELAQKRINILYDYFTTQFVLQPERISTVTPDLPTEKSNGPANGVTITLQAISQ